MSKILDQLKSARKNRKASSPIYDDASLDTIIEHNTPKQPKGPSLKRLIIIVSVGLVFIIVSAVMATQVAKRKKQPNRPYSSLATPRAGEPSPEGLTRPPFSEAGGMVLASAELAAKKAEALPMEILSIESIDEGPIIEEIELEPAPIEGPEKKPAVPIEIEAVELRPAPPGPPGREVVKPAPTRGPEKPPPTPLEVEIETVELRPAPPATLEIEVVELEPVPVEEPEKLPAVPPEIEVVEIKPAPVERPEELPAAPPTPVLPRVAEQERPVAPRIEIKVEEPTVPRIPGAVVAEKETAAPVEAPPAVVMEVPAHRVEAPPIPVLPPVPPKTAEAPRIEVKAAPEAVPERPPVLLPPSEVMEEVHIEARPPAVAEVPKPPPAAPAPVEEAPQPSAVAPVPLPPGEKLLTTADKLKKREMFKLAVFYQKSGELRKAKEQYLEIIKLDPMDPETHNNLGSIHHGWGDLDNAINEYRKAILLRPHYYKARNNLGVALYQKGNMQAALREFQFVVEANPNDIQSLTNLGVVSRKMGQPERARKFFEKALSIDQTHAEAHYNLALILEESEVASAIFHYQKFLEYSGGRYASLEEEVMQHLNKLSKKPWR